jgi:hypothetical protein
LAMSSSLSLKEKTPGWLLTTWERWLVKALSNLCAVGTRVHCSTAHPTQPPRQRKSKFWVFFKVLRKF